MRPASRPVRAAVAIVGLGASLLAASACFAATGRARAFVPDESAPVAPAFADGAYVVETPAYSLSLRLLDDAARRAFVGRRLGSPEDPFAPLPGQPPGLLAFLVSAENRGKGDVVLEPDATRIVGRDRESFYPVGWHDIESAYAMLGRDVPPAQARAREVLLDGQRVLKPGRGEEGLLVFRLPPAGMKRFVVELSLTLPDGSAAGFAAPYRLEKK